MLQTAAFGGAERDRTAGLLVANEALSQLSYSPTLSDFYILPAIPRFRYRGISGYFLPGTAHPARSRFVRAATFAQWVPI